ncbi:hypothetical protein DID75_00255 [Candidatus Marinamargulisbacteria bacterium SCGC AG-410-N11]|nr:hypothetical protein DID75_00255 [Candidatus Marinamargulisbacteria bacterium SCGC AG-410-N11]
MQWVKQFFNFDFLEILDRNEKKVFWLIIILMSVFSLVEAFTYTLIVPYINVIIDPDRIYSIAKLQPILKWLNLTESKQLVILISIIFLGMYSIKSGLQLITNYFIAKFPQTISQHRMAFMYSKYLKMNYRSYLEKNTKEMVKVLTQNVYQVGVLIQSSLFFISYLITCIGLVLILINKSLITTVIIMIFFVLSGSVVHLSIKNRQKKAGVDLDKSYNTVYKITSDSLTLIKDIRLYKKTEYFIDKVAAVVKNVCGAYKVNAFLSGLPGVLLEYLVIIFLVLFSLIFILKGIDIKSYGTLFIFYAVVGRRLLSCLGQVISAKNTINFCKASYETYKSELQYIESEKFEITENIAEKDFNSMSLQNISFSYKPKLPILKNISLDIKKDELIAFVGTSGSGKTTLVDVIGSFLKPSSGEFLVNGQKKESLSSIRHKMGYVPQQMLILDDSFKNNIALGCDSIDQNRLNQAIKLAHLDELINELDQGVDTILGDRGIQLSGGQRQRVAIARALYVQPEILLFDEATSALDAKSEKVITNSILNLRGKMTVIAVAHRLSTIKGFDKIFVLENGQIVNAGTHQELIKSCSTYNKMVTLGALD